MNGGGQCPGPTLRVWRRSNWTELSPQVDTTSTIDTASANDTASTASASSTTPSTSQGESVDLDTEDSDYEPFPSMYSTSNGGGTLV